jgi:hypothetical protein
MTAATTLRANFLTIPGELRNKIYRLALISDGKIVVAKGQFVEPRLLRTCRQIRTEATKIYYLENEWTIDYPNWEYSIAEAFVNHVQIVQEFDFAQMKTYWRNSGSYKNRANLLELAKVLHEGKRGLRWLCAGENPSVLISATMGVNEIAKAMKESPWDQVERVLGFYLQQVPKQTSGWSWE